MDAYSQMLDTNYRLIMGEKLGESEKNAVISVLMSAANGRSTEEIELKKNGRNMYPLFFVPPDNGGKKYRTVLGQAPKTEIFSANMYELEILRLLYLLSPENGSVTAMAAKTLERLKTTCFGYQDDGVGECFDASLVVLRFLATVAADEKEWIYSRIDNYNRHRNDKKRPWFSVWYYWLCLSELPFETAKTEADKYKDEIITRLFQKSYIMNRESDKTLHPVLLSILRNLLSKYPEYSCIKERRPYVSDKDGRLYFDMAR